MIIDQLTKKTELIIDFFSLSLYHSLLLLLFIQGNNNNNNRQQQQQQAILFSAFC